MYKKFLVLIVLIFCVSCNIIFDYNDDNITETILSTEKNDIIINEIENYFKYSVEKISKFYFTDHLGHYDNPKSYAVNVLPLIPSFVSEEFKSLVSEKEYLLWEQSFETIPYNTVTRLSEYLNIYSFIKYFNISNDSVVEAIEKYNKNYILPDDPMDEELIENYLFSDEEIKAILERDEEQLIKLFLKPYNQFLVQQNDRFFNVIWFHNHSVKNYISEEIQLETLLKGYEAIKKIPTIRIFAIDCFENKIINFVNETNSDFNVIELFEYDRDITMPPPFEEFYTIDFFTFYYKDDKNYIKYDEFFIEYNKDNVYQIKNPFTLNKNDKFYSPAWVYYNLTTAYIEAGITPEELLEMLPKYKELGVLTPEATVALENKINKYAADYSSLSE